MLVDRVLADLDVPDPEERGGLCSECDEAVSAKGLCRRHYDRARYIANRTAILARETARSKARYWRNPEIGRAMSRAKQQRRRARDPELSRREWRAWMADLPRARRASCRKAASYRARKRGAFVEIVDFDAILIRDAGRCGICFAPVPPLELHFDHIIPLARGGAHLASNIQVAHRRCNVKKGDREAKPHFWVRRSDVEPSNVGRLVEG